MRSGLAVNTSEMALPHSRLKRAVSKPRYHFRSCRCWLRHWQSVPLAIFAFICGERGEPLTKESFGNMFKAACKAAGVPGSAHGIRKIAATRAANAGATEAELMAIFGWTDPKMASHYTKTANRKRLAAQAMTKLATSIPAPSYQLRERAAKAQ